MKTYVCISHAHHRHEELYVRRACEPFNMDGPDFVRCRAAHLTNISVQKQHPRFGEDRFVTRTHTHSCVHTDMILQPRCLTDRAPPVSGMRTSCAPSSGSDSAATEHMRS